MIKISYFCILYLFASKLESRHVSYESCSPSMHISIQISDLVFIHEWGLQKCPLFFLDFCLDCWVLIISYYVLKNELNVNHNLINNLTCEWGHPDLLQTSETV